VRPFTAPWVPTGMNMGVRQAKCGKVMRAARAAPLRARSSKASGDEGGAGGDGDGPPSAAAPIARRARV
jgi:hypothetical protein